ncbi:MAG TPA: gephyrin-like molybdotransferase Glp [Candidatus Dormibacteraeota bacterium]
MSVARSTPALVSVDDARHLLLDGLHVLASEEVDLADALGRVLASDIRALTDLPGTDNSAMDGYAVVAADVAAATSASPVRLPLGGEARAGRPAAEHAPRTATVIATGAPIPRGADAVVAVELTDLAGGWVRFSAGSALGRHIRRRGEDVVAGTHMLAAGHRLRSVDVGVCAAAGLGRVSVARRPRVALLGNGDELVPPGVTPQPHQVSDVNGAMLAAAVVEAGGTPLPFGVAGDERAIVRDALAMARDDSDLIVSTAGVSMGSHDHVRDCVAELGKVRLWMVAMRPGRPLVIGQVGSTPFLGLPGNPVSSAVTFLLFARSALLALQGATRLLPPMLTVTLGESVEKPAPLETYVRVRLDAGVYGPVAWPSGGQGPAMMHGLADADALVKLPAGETAFAAGSTAVALLLP